MTTWQEVEQASGVDSEVPRKCRKCKKFTTGTFNEVTQKCFKCHMEET